MLFRLLLFISQNAISQRRKMTALTFRKKENPDLQTLWHNFYNSGLCLLEVCNRRSESSTEGIVAGSRSSLGTSAGPNQRIYGWSKNSGVYSYLKKNFIDDPSIRGFRKFQSDCMQKSRSFVDQPALFDNSVFVDPGSGNQQHRGIFFLFWTESVRCAV